MATILLVDDDKTLHAILKEALPLYGHRLIASAFDGVEAIKVYTQLEPKPDIIVMDQQMPRRDGVTTTWILTHMNTACRILFLSANEQVREAALAAGAAAFRAKPVSLHDLHLLINSLLQPPKQEPVEFPVES